jgi:hypothetical protein
MTCANSFLAEFSRLHRPLLLCFLRQLPVAGGLHTVHRYRSALLTRRSRFVAEMFGMKAMHRKCPLPRLRQTHHLPGQDAWLVQSVVGIECLCGGGVRLRQFALAEGRAPMLTIAVLQGLARRVGACPSCRRRSCAGVCVQGQEHAAPWDPVAAQTIGSDWGSDRDRQLRAGWEGYPRRPLALGLRCVFVRDI